MGANHYYVRRLSSQAEGRRKMIAMAEELDRCTEKTPTEAELERIREAAATLVKELQTEDNLAGELWKMKVTTDFKDKMSSSFLAVYVAILMTLPAGIFWVQLDLNLHKKLFNEKSEKLKESVKKMKKRLSTVEGVIKYGDKAEKFENMLEIIEKMEERLSVLEGILVCADKDADEEKEAAGMVDDAIEKADDDEAAVKVDVAGKKADDKAAGMVDDASEKKADDEGWLVRWGKFIWRWYNLLKRFMSTICPLHLTLDMYLKQLHGKNMMWSCYLMIIFLCWVP